MCELGMSLVTCCAQEKLLIAKKESEIRAMGAMTGAAFSLLDQGVFVVILFSLNTLLGILMARETDLGLSGLLEVALIRGMGAVTAHAEDTRTNVAVDLLKIFRRGRVAGQASGRPFGLESQGMLGPHPVVTGNAFLLGKRSVEAILDQAIAVRPVRRMARHTVRALYGVAKMGLLRGAVFYGMAGHAELLSVFFDQVLVIRGVGRVAA